MKSELTLEKSLPVSFPLDCGDPRLQARGQLSRKILEAPLKGTEMGMTGEPPSPSLLTCQMHSLSRVPPGLGGN